MRFSAKKLSVSEAGDYFQLSLEGNASAAENVEDSDVSPYLIVQRSFEPPDTRSCYLETHDPDYCGHFRLRLFEFNRTTLVFEIDPRGKRRVEVALELEEREFENARRIVQLLFGG